MAIKSMFKIIFFVLLFAFTNLNAETAGEIYNKTGIKGGLVVHLGCGIPDATGQAGKLTIELYSEKYVIHGLDIKTENVEKARKYIQSKGLYGKVSVNVFDGINLPYTDNLVNLIIADNPGQVSIKEIMRVLAPLGVAYIGGKKTVKPWPDNIDEWTHFLHSPDNNAVAKDTVIGPPRHIQWKSVPLWDRAHDTFSAISTVVSAKGRIFSIIDTAPIKMATLRGRFKIIARDAFNGKLLWTRDIIDWEPITRPYRTGPAQLGRRMTVVNDRVFVTLQDNAPVVMLDSASGKILKTYNNTKPVQEIIYHNGILFLISGHEAPDGIAYSESGRTYFFKRAEMYKHDPIKSFSYIKGKDFSGYKCRILAVDSVSGKLLWEEGEMTGGYQGCSLAVDSQRVVFQTENSIICLNRNTGKKIWETAQKLMYGKRGEHSGASITVVISEENATVYAVHPCSYIICYSLKNGNKMWQVPIDICNYHAPPDLFVVGNTVWANNTNGYDAKTGRVKSNRSFSFDKPMAHDRCYRNRATVKYIIESKSGGADFSVLNSKEEYANAWVRGGCQYGILPCNGLLYALPHPCQCVPTVMLAGFHALSAAREDEKAPGFSDRLEKGPAFNSTDQKVYHGKNNENYWPAYRHDNKRSGVTGSYVGKDLKVIWKKKIISTIPSAPVIADNKLFLADVDAHTVLAFNQETGRNIWKYTAGARIDSPPAWYKGIVIFGSRDGCVYCLRANNGIPAWRFQAAPEERYVGIFDQLESAWPVRGSVMVKDGRVYFAAGRNSFLDHGIYLYCLDAMTGKKISQKRIYGPYDKDGHPIITSKHHFSMKGSKASILSAEDDQIYMRHLAFNLKLEEIPEENIKGHIIPSAGFLDDQLFNRSVWTFGRRIQLSERNDGDQMIRDNDTLYCHQGQASGRGGGMSLLKSGYKLMGGSIKEVSWTKARRPERFADFDGKINFHKFEKKWQTFLKTAPRAMIKAGDYIYVAGTIHLYPPSDEDPWEALEGRKGSLLEIFKDKEKVAQYQLDSMPCWDGMAAADGKLFISLTNGTIVCMGE